MRSCEPINQHVKFETEQTINRSAANLCSLETKEFETISVIGVSKRFKSSFMLT